MVAGRRRRGGDVAPPPLAPGETAAPRPVEARGRFGVHRTTEDWEPREAMRTRAFWVLTIVLPVIALAGPAFMTHIIAFFISRGLSPQSAAFASTSFIIGTGFMKCMPMTSAGRLVCAAISVIEIELVFVASSAPAGASRSSSAKSLILRSRRSCGRGSATACTSSTATSPWARSRRWERVSC